MMGPLVVIGGNAAGMSAAAEARRTDSAREITVLEAGPDVSYSACGIPYVLSGEVASVDDLVSLTPERFRRDRDIEVRTSAAAVAIDAGARRVRLADGGVVGYGGLIVATGARPVRPPVPGVELAGVYTLRDLRSARRLEAAIGACERPRAVLVGSGPIGLEMAEALLARGARVTIVEVAPRVMPALAADAAAPVTDALGSAGVEMRPGAHVTGIALAGRSLAVTVDGDEVPADLVVLGTGVEPAARIAAEAGCALGDRGAIAVDRRGRTSVEGVWAVGDCAVAHHALLERAIWMPLATVANAQGRVAGRDAAGRPARFAGALGAWVSRFGQIAFGAVGIDEETAADEGFVPHTITREGRDRSGYMPGVRSILVRLVWDEPTGRLLGAQMSGDGEVAARLHTVAVAITAGMTVRELAGCDFGYAPPVSALRDPVELAAAAAVGDAR